MNQVSKLSLDFVCANTGVKIIDKVTANTKKRLFVSVSYNSLDIGIYNKFRELSSTLYLKYHFIPCSWVKF